MAVLTFIEISLCINYS